jgi:hypothetical protein
MVEADESNIIRFRCPKELEGLIPAPTAAAHGLPKWFKDMPAHTGDAAPGEETVKRCPPFIDAMTCGFLIPLICDVKVDKGEFTWDADLPAGAVDFARSPIGFHPGSQVAGTPLYEPDRYLIRFHNLWTIETPKGWSLLFTHPVNRFDLPFTTLTGLVDSDLFHDAWINFPARWSDPGFSGVLAKGTPIAQCFPFKRGAWSLQAERLTEEEERRAHRVINAVRRDRGVYRRRFRARRSLRPPQRP